jgi:hypothetical protein
VGVDLRWAVGADLHKMDSGDPQCMSNPLTYNCWIKVDIYTHSGDLDGNFLTVQNQVC